MNLKKIERIFDQQANNIGFLVQQNNPLITRFFVGTSGKQVNFEIRKNNVTCMKYVGDVDESRKSKDQHPNNATRNYFVFRFKICRKIRNYEW